jgi:hypothetical protein
LGFRKTAFVDMEANEIRNTLDEVSWVRLKQVAAQSPDRKGIPAVYHGMSLSALSDFQLGKVSRALTSTYEQREVATKVPEC